MVRIEHFQLVEATILAAIAVASSKTTKTTR